MKLKRIIHSIIYLLIVSGAVLVILEDYFNGIFSIVVAVGLRIFRDKLISLYKNK